MKWVERKRKIQPNERDSIIEKIAKIRGIKDVNRFLHPSKEEMFDPYLIKNIEDASNRIISAIGNNEKIIASFDPDADGLTACATMLRYLKNYTENVDYIYGERNDGHGIYEMTRLPRRYIKDEKGNNIEEEVSDLIKENVEKIKSCDLLILIDSSSNDTKTCKYISENFGCDIIIIDHHAIERDNPYVTLVNPQQDGDEYPNKFLSGAGMVFKVMQVMEDTLGQVDPFQYMDLVAVGMYADIMRIDVLENRYMIMHGMRNMKNVGLVRILKGGKVDLFKINCNAIGFTIAPILNGTARMDSIKLAIDILLTDDDNVAKKLRLQMQKLNESRKELQKSIIKQYMTKVNHNEKVLIVLDEQSSKGFNGIVAQQLSDIYKRPVIVGRLYKNTASGSFRSYGNFDMKEFLKNSELLEDAVGHPQAGGFTVKEDNLEDLIEYIEKNLPELEDKEPTIIYDLEINPNEVDEYIKYIEEFNLLVGNGFPKILTKIKGVAIESVDCIGKTQETVKIKTLDNMELIKFRVNDKYASELGIFDEIDVVGQLQINEFFNFQTKKKTITNQLLLEDYAFVE